MHADDYRRCDCEIQEVRGEIRSAVEESKTLQMVAAWIIARAILVRANVLLQASGIEGQT
jgi:hypothetical protein